jgi:hypothetical protein
MDQSKRLDFIDFSQFNSFQKCPWFWAERYLRGYKQTYAGALQRDDAMAIGSLVHDGLEQYYKNSCPMITAATVEEIALRH